MLTIPKKPPNRGGDKPRETTSLYIKYPAVSRRKNIAAISLA
jgi:hypothetical protein